MLLLLLLLPLLHTAARGTYRIACCAKFLADSMYAVWHLIT